MKDKHIKLRMKQCLLLAGTSSCVRQQVGAMLVDPIKNVVLSDGYNGGPRGGYKLCGPTGCLRNEKKIKSGERSEVGCHHAETNTICNAAANGTITRGAWLFVTHPCCLMCAKMVHHAGIEKVIVIKGNYSTDEGLSYLKENNIHVQEITVEE